MRHSNHGRFRQQFRFLSRQFLQNDELPLSNVLSEDIVSNVLQETECSWIDRIYTPLVTLWVFLSQVLSADHSCQGAVARLVAHRVAHGQLPCSPKTGAYCQARKRLPENLFSLVTRGVGRALDDNASRQWLWKGRRVYIFDGSTVSMPDTQENQAAYPQLYNQKPGVGFPIARVAALFSLSCGAIVEFGIRRYAGKGQSELGILRSFLDTFRPGDVVVADRNLCSWSEMVMLKQRGVDCVCRMKIRKPDFKKGKQLGIDDHIVPWPKPRSSRSIDRESYKALPDFLTVRECQVRIKRPGFRIKTLLLATTLLSEEFNKKDFAQVYFQRWNAELDLRSLKQTLQMDILRCKTPELVRKEIWTHILAYNLIRTVMAQAATEHDIQPRSVSFKGTVQTLEAFQPLLAFQRRFNDDERQELYEKLLAMIASHRVANRPGRFEPRRSKRRPQNYDRLMKPRNEAKAEMLQRLKAN